MSLDEASFLRMLNKFPRVRGPDYYVPPIKKSKRKTGGLLESTPSTAPAKRVPISIEERAELEAERAGAGSLLAGAANGAMTLSPPLEDGGDFFKVFDAWVDSQWEDRTVRTKVKVGFRKEHKKMIGTMNLEDIEDVASCL